MVRGMLSGTVMRLSTAAIPGGAQAARSAASRSAHESTRSTSVPPERRFESLRRFVPQWAQPSHSLTCSMLAFVNDFCVYNLGRLACAGAGVLLGGAGLRLLEC